MRNLLISATSVAALAMAAGLASADPAAPGADTAVTPQAVLGGDYSYSGLNQGLGHADSYGGDFGVVLPAPYSSDFSGQISGGYHRIESGGFGANDGNVAGTMSWDSTMGRLGANVGYASTNVRGASVDATNYGAYGEYYAGDRITLGLRGGGVTGAANAFGVGSASSTGGYGGGEAVAYLMPDLAARATVGYVGIADGHQWTAGLHGEYLFSETTPLSGWVGYDYSSIGAEGFAVHANTFSIGLKYYFGGSGSLERHQRTGEDDWGPSTIDLTH
jgi:hypothetical protein